MPSTRAQSDADPGRLPAASAPAAALAAWSTLLDGLQEDGPDAQACLARVDTARRALLGPGLLTISLHDAATATLQRVWSSDPQAYPVGGRKHKPESPWSRQVLQQCEPFVAEGDAALASAFDDHDRIASLGLHSALNVPLTTGGRCLATFNLLRPQAHWPAPDRVVGRLLALAAFPAILQAASLR